MKIIVSILIGAVLSMNAVVFGAVKDGGYTITPIIGGYFYDNTHNLDPSLMVGLRGGYNVTDTVAVEALYDYVTQTDGKSGPLSKITMHRYGAQALYHFFPKEKFVPYLATGYSGSNFAGSGITNSIHGAFDYGAGVKYFLKDDIAVRGDVRHILYRHNVTSFTDLEFSLGVTFQFGGAVPVVKAVVPPAPVVVPPPMPEPVKAVTEPQVKVDVAPAVPVAKVEVPVPAVPVAPVAVTPVPVPVAPVATPVVIPPPDSDGDGVIDLQDKCPGTPAGVVVVSSGCPVDSDTDGVSDYLDKCPGTPAGTVVGANGCPVEVAKKFCDKPAIIEVAFDSNKSDIKSRYYSELDKLGAFLKEFPSAKGTIEGHTDADGSKEANIKLSQARAESVRKYIIGKFNIEPVRILAVGYGPVKPVASNKTVAGKAKNRRIEAKFSCE